MPDFETKDSGQHEQYDSGMRRDSQDGKPRFDLIRTKAQPYRDQMIYRYAMLLARGAAKYSSRNWEEGTGEEELERAKASLLRHTEQLVAGETDEDHAAAVWFNTQAIEYFRWRIAEKIKNGLEQASIISTSKLSGTLVSAVPTPSAEQHVLARIDADILDGTAWFADRVDRVDSWLEHYSIDLIKGDLGDPHQMIALAEFKWRLTAPGVEWSVIPGEPKVDGAFEIQ
jgi:hypothetical protein